MSYPEGTAEESGSCSGHTAATPNASYLDSFPATVLVCGLCRPVWVILAGHTQPLQKPISETIVRAAGEVFPAGSKDSLVKTKETG